MSVDKKVDKGEDEKNPNASLLSFMKFLNVATILFIFWSLWALYNERQAAERQAASITLPTVTVTAQKTPSTVDPE